MAAVGCKELSLPMSYVGQMEENCVQDNLQGKGSMKLGDKSVELVARLAGLSPGLPWQEAEELFWKAVEEVKWSGQTETTGQTKK